jgi:hypothetical protein
MRVEESTQTYLAAEARARVEIDRMLAAAGWEVHTTSPLVGLGVS